MRRKPNGCHIRQPLDILRNALPMRTAIYVDGFNLYHAIKYTKYKWLNPLELVHQVLPSECRVERLRYFTAPVKAVFDRDAPKRQEVYIKALKTLPEVKVHFGRFRPNTKRGPLLNLPVANRWIATQKPVKLPQGDHLVSGQQEQVLPVRRKLEDYSGGRSGSPADSVPNGVVAEIQTMVEKGSDVNLAAHLLNDAWKDLFDVAAVISNDSDLATPINMVKTERMKKIFIVCPPTHKVARDLLRAATGVHRIRDEHLGRAQFRDPLTDAISKPPRW